VSPSTTTDFNATFRLLTMNESKPDSETSHERKKTMNTNFKFSDDRFAMYAAVVATIALLAIAVFASEKAAAQPVSAAKYVAALQVKSTIQKLDPILVV